jgi:hypothetical protein
MHEGMMRRGCFRDAPLRPRRQERNEYDIGVGLPMMEADSMDFNISPMQEQFRYSAPDI